MFKTKLTVSILTFTIFLVVTSIIKNKTRIIEKQISNLNTNILVMKNNINEAQLDFYYLSSPSKLEKKLNIIGFKKYQPVKNSNLYFGFNSFLKFHNSISKLNK